MALGQNKRYSSMKLKRGRMDGEADGFVGLKEFVRYTRSFGSKRILVSRQSSGDGDGDGDGYGDLMPLDSSPSTPLKRLCSGRLMTSLDAEDDNEKSPIESLPQDILIGILCGVDHDDLKQLIHVSKTIKEATLMAKKWHFAYSTPTKTRAFRTRIDFESPNELDEIEAPSAPKRLRSYRSGLKGKSLVDVSVALFASLHKNGPFVETEI